VVRENPGNSPSSFPFYFFAATSPERFSPPVIFAGNELQNRTKGVRRAGTEDTVVETLFGSYFYDLLLRVRIATALSSPYYSRETPGRSTRF